MKYVFPGTNISVNFERINPFRLIRVRAQHLSSRPTPELTSTQLPNGTADEFYNVNDPQYREKLKIWRSGVEAALVQALIQFGISSVDNGALDGRTESELSALSRVLYAVSFPTEEGIRSMIDSADPLFVEAIITARWLDEDVNVFLSKDIDYQNLMIGARRKALGK